MVTLRKWGLALSVLSCAAVTVLAGAAIIPNMQPFRDPTGYVATNNKNGAIQKNSAFFQSLGTNGRTCETCHQVDQAFSITLSSIQQRFTLTQGQDPLFATIDGANCPTDPRGQAASHSLPANPQFTLTAVYDPYGCAIMTDPLTGLQEVSIYRRPLPSTNVGFLSTIMFDGRETIDPLNNEQTFQANLATDLSHQAMDAVLTHAQGLQPPTQEQLTEIVNFELGLNTAQLADDQAGPLYQGGANGGPLYLSTFPYYPGMNDSLGGDPLGKPFDPSAMTVFAAWQSSGSDNDGYGQGRSMVAAGEKLFNTKAVHITGVRGLNDNQSLGYPQEITGTCTTCHDTPNVGNHSFPLPLDIGTSHTVAYERNPLIAESLTQLSQPDVPIYRITGCNDPVTGRPLTFYTSDPGKGLVTGQCADVNRGKGPVLRGLAARAPYFHNGSAANLQELVNFYNNRFSMGLTDDEKQQLIAFLNSL
jgi:cytochrome c peroxidase